jgi:hypothetical protein
LAATGDPTYEGGMAAKRTRCLSAAIALLPLLVRPPAAAALTQIQIEAGANAAPVGAREVTTQLASDAFQGRDNLTEGSRRAQAYLIPLLREIGTGVGGGTDDDVYRHPFFAGTNLIAVVRGRELPDEYVMVGAHYDHLGVAANGDVYNGATDNAAGVAVAIAVGRAIRRLPEPPRRSVVIALWDAEEDGLLGSMAYVAAPALPLDKTVAYVNLDIQGANLTPGLARTSIAVGPETGGPRLVQAVDDAVDAELARFPHGVDTVSLSFVFGQLRSDYASFVAAGVPTVFFSDSTNACYHTVKDESRFVDFDKLASQSRITYRLTADLAEASSTPRFVAPITTLATYDDAVTLDHIFARAMADLNRFDSPERRTVQAIVADVDAIVARGADAFGLMDVGTLLQAAVKTLAAVATLPCNGQFPRGGVPRLPGEPPPGGRRPIDTALPAR